MVYWWLYGFISYSGVGSNRKSCSDWRWRKICGSGFRYTVPYTFMLLFWFLRESPHLSMRNWLKPVRKNFYVCAIRVKTSSEPMLGDSLIVLFVAFLFHPPPLELDYIIVCLKIKFRQINLESSKNKCGKGQWHPSITLDVTWQGVYLNV